VDAQLVGLAIEEQADLIVVGTHQWHGLSRLRHGSVSRGILRHAPMSVACVPTLGAAPIAGPKTAAHRHDSHGSSARTDDKRRHYRQCDESATSVV
jgi:hypothetical protein